MIGIGETYLVGNELWEVVWVDPETKNHGQCTRYNLNGKLVRGDKLVCGGELEEWPFLYSTKHKMRVVQ